MEEITVIYNDLDVSEEACANNSGHSILPPPPRHSGLSPYAPPGSNPNVPVVETSNSIRHPEGGCPLQVGEGTYELREDLHLAVPPAHPVEGVAPNTNPLATNVQSPTAGVKVSLVVIQPRRQQPQLYSLKSGLTSDLQRIKEAEDETLHAVPNGNSVFDSGSAPVFGESNLALQAATTSSATSVPKDGSGLKRRKPKNNIVKSSSSFVSRVVVNELATKKLSERNPEGLYVLLNVDRAFHWLDFASKVKHEPLSKVLFTKAHVLSHDVNELTKSATHLDIIMGSSASDILWYEPMQQKYARINKNGTINNSSVSDIKWLPGSENLFMAAHSNGCLVVYDKEKEDAPFVPEESEPVLSTPDGKPCEGQSPNSFKILKSVNSQNQKTNPVAYWKLSNKKINQFALSPDNRHLAVVLEDGSLRILDYLKEQMLDLFPSYYGGLLCVCWSPDGQYILTGGEDDLVSIWSLAERNIVARCQGHNSWVTYVAFDPWRCDERNYRFGSVGDDCRLLLWDFSVAMLHRPKVLQTSARQRNSIAAASSQPSRYRNDSLSTSRVRSESIATDNIADGQDDLPVKHPVEPRARTAQLPPIMSKVVSEEPLSWIGFLEDSIMTASLKGPVRTWDRPHELGAEKSASDSTSSSAAN